MDDVTIRRATINDLPTLLLFEQGIIEAERPFDKTLKRTGTTYYDLDTMLVSDTVYLAVAQVSDRLVGCGYARIELSKTFVQHTQHAYLGFMYVLPEHRGKGINQKIMGTLKNWAFSQGITELRLEVYYSNQSAIKAYEKFGFQKLMIEMRLGI